MYALLERLRPTAPVRVNRAFAVARASGAAAGLSLLDSAEIEGVAAYAYFHLVRGTLLAELGRGEEARGELERALGQARNGDERGQIRARLAELDGAVRLT